MARIRPFQGVRYDTARTGNLGKVLAPPYDVLSEQDKRKLLSRNERNIVAVDLIVTKVRDILEHC
jgi:uncharacterized protein (DUF1015 family)